MRAIASHQGKSAALRLMSPPARQFLSVALPIMVTLVVSIWLASISQNKRLDDIVRRLERMESKRDLHEERLVRVEERTSPLRR
jgi:hypothetical protein